MVFYFPCLCDIFFLSPASTIFNSTKMMIIILFLPKFPTQELFPLQIWTIFFSLLPLSLSLLALKKKTFHISFFSASIRLFWHNSRIFIIAEIREAELVVLFHNHKFVYKSERLLSYASGTQKNKRKYQPEWHKERMKNGTCAVSFLQQKKFEFEIVFFLVWVSIWTTTKQLEKNVTKRPKYQLKMRTKLW